MPIERKYERDIDLVLAEEFSVNPAFSSWFVSLTKFGGRGTYVSLKGDRGLMDLAFSNTTAHVFAELVKHHFPEDMSIHQTSASAEIRFEVSGFQVAE